MGINSSEGIWSRLAAAFARALRVAAWVAPLGLVSFPASAQYGSIPEASVPSRSPAEAAKPKSEANPKSGGAASTKTEANPKSGGSTAAKTEANPKSGGTTAAKTETNSKPTGAATAKSDTTPKSAGTGATKAATEGASKTGQTGPAGAPGAAADSGSVMKSAATAAKPPQDATPKPVVVATPRAVTKTFALAPISENSAPSGCGCFFYRPTDKREMGPLLLHMDGQGSATLRPEGQLVAMKLIDEQHSRRNPPAISAQDRVLLKMRGRETNASLSGIAEKNCMKNPTGNSCSSVSYQSILTIDHAGKKISQPAWGFCGCR